MIYETNQSMINGFNNSPFLSNFNQDINPLASSYWSPKYHVSLNPIVRQTKSNRSLPVDLHCNVNSLK